MKNKYEIRGDVTAIFINCQGKTYETIIDTVDLIKVNDFPNSWFGHKEKENGNIYVVGKITIGYKKRKSIQLHRLVMNAEEGILIDHIYHDTLDNRSSKLRKATKSQNNQNRKGTNINNKSSGIQNVYFEKGKYAIRVKCKFIKRVDSIEIAEDIAKKARLKLMPFSKDALFNSHNEDQLFKDQEESYATNKYSKQRNVKFIPTKQRWVVNIDLNRHRIHVGWFDEFNDAVVATKQSRMLFKCYKEHSLEVLFEKFKDINVIKLLRRIKKIKQDELSKILNMSQVSLSKIERSRKVPVKLLSTLEELLDIGANKKLIA